MRFRPLLAIATAVLLHAFVARGTDVTYYAIIKSQQYVQTSSGAPVLPPANAFAFDALVGTRTTNLMTTATVTPPSATPQQTLQLQPGGTNFQFEQRFDTQAALDAAYPTRIAFFLPAYGMTMSSVNDGTRSDNLSFGTFGIAGGYPSTPQIGNFDAAQAVDTTTSFTLLWSVSGGQTLDIVQVTIYDAATNTVFSSPPPLSVNSLNGTSTSITIPPGALPPGETLNAHLSVGRPAAADTNSYPGAVGAALLGQDVVFPLVTRPAPVRPHLTLAAAPTKPVQIQFTGETNRNYHLQVTTNFTSWQDLLVTNLPTATGAYTDVGAGGSSRRFYRIEVGP